MVWVLVVLNFRFIGNLKFCIMNKLRNILDKPVHQFMKFDTTTIPFFNRQLAIDVKAKYDGASQQCILNVTLSYWSHSIVQY